MRAHQRKIVAGAIVVIARNKATMQSRLPSFRDGALASDPESRDSGSDANAPPRNDGLLRRDPRQMNGAPERLLRQFIAIDENAQAEQPAGPKWAIRRLIGLSESSTV